MKKKLQSKYAASNWASVVFCCIQIRNNQENEKGNSTPSEQFPHLKMKIIDIGTNLIYLSEIFYRGILSCFSNEMKHKNTTLLEQFQNLVDTLKQNGYHLHTYTLALTSGLVQAFQQKVVFFMSIELSSEVKWCDHVSYFYI